MISDLCRLPLPVFVGCESAWACSSARSCASDSPPIPTAPRRKKSRRDTPSQCRADAAGPRSVSMIGRLRQLGREFGVEGHRAAAPIVSGTVDGFNIHQLPIPARPPPIGVSALGCPFTDQLINPPVDVRIVE